jgi:glycine C-acetyltransferase
VPVDRLEWLISEELAALGRSGTRKGAETVIRAVVPPERGRGPRYRLEGEDDRPFLRMNSNGYLGLALRPEVQAAQEQAARAFGAGPAAVRFISGTFAPHVALERELAEFHGREAAMLFGSAYAAMMGVLPPLVTPETLVVSDELNHSCIINALRLARPAAKHVYPHLDVARVEQLLARGAGRFQRAIVVTDGVFSMRGDHAPLDRLVDLAGKYDASFPQNVLLVVDDSHGVGALGASGRGTEERTGSGPVDLLVATLGKALGVNGGYAAGSRIVIEYLRETSPFYVYSNPIGPAEAAAARRALALLRSDVGRALLEHLRAMTRRFADGLVRLGWETLPGEHPVVPLLVRDTARTAALVAHLRRHGVLATGLAYPVVPRGEEEIRFQLSADHTPADVDEALAALASFPDRS